MTNEEEMKIIYRIVKHYHDDNYTFELFLNDNAKDIFEILNLERYRYYLMRKYGKFKRK